MIATRDVFSGGRLYLTFTHEHHNPPVVRDRGHKGGALVKATTTCLVSKYLKDLDTYPILSQGMAYCAVEDNFSRETGRQIALRRALKTLFLKPDLPDHDLVGRAAIDREARGACLDAYFSRPRGRSAPARFFLTMDNDSHHYVVPFAQRAAWMAFVELPAEDERSWDVPAWARRVDGGILTFADWKVE